MGKSLRLEKPRYVVIFITASSDREAKTIANELLNQKKAACVNILSGVQSLFWWEGKVDSAREVLLIVKTESGLVGDVIELVKKFHSYQVPEIIALPVVGGNEDYLNWISESVTPKVKR